MPFNKIKVNKPNLLLPVQCVPFPLYPLLQEQLYDPGVFVQYAFVSHGEVEHSLISGKIHNI